MLFDNINVKNLIVPRYDLSNVAGAAFITRDGIRIEFAVHIGDAFFVITKKMLSRWGWSLNLLEEIAVRNVMLHS